MTQRPHQRRGLGRGLGSLIPTAPRPVTDTVGAEPDPAAPPHSDDAASGNRQGDGPEQTFLERQPEALAGTHLERPSDGGTSGDASSAASTATEEPGPEGADPSTPQPEERWTDQDAKDHAVESAPEPSLQSADPSGSPSAEQSADQSTSPSPEDSAEKSWGQSSDLPGDLAPVDGAYFAELPVSAIRPNPRQPRQVFDEDALAELVQSIQQVGLLQPIVVRPAGEGAYELIMGERRWRATQDAGLDTIPAIVRETEDDDLLRDALLENLHRAQLNPLEEAAAYQQLLDDFGCTHEELATRIGRSRPQISNTLRLLKLTPAVQRRVAAGILSAGHARALLGVEDPGAQDRLAGRVVAESISVRGLEELVAVGAIDGDTAAPVRRSKPTAPGLADLAARLSDRLETRVKVDLGKRKGRITVEFASLPDLERIIALIDPEPQTTQDSWATGTGA